MVHRYPAAVKAFYMKPDPQRPDNLYLLPYDANVKQLAATGFPMWDVKTALRRQIKAPVFTGLPSRRTGPADKHWSVF